MASTLEIDHAEDLLGRRDAPYCCRCYATAVVVVFDNGRAMCGCCHADQLREIAAAEDRVSRMIEAQELAARGYAGAPEATRRLVVLALTD